LCSDDCLRILCTVISFIGLTASFVIKLPNCSSV
jgi:hypothetical protein